MTSRERESGPADLTGRVLGTMAALGGIALWVAFLFHNPYAPPAEGRVFLFGSLMMLAGAVSAAAAAIGAHLAMYLLFFISFFPVGVYSLLGPGVFRAIGWLNLAYFLAAVLVHRAILTAKKRGQANA